MWNHCFGPLPLWLCFLKDCFHTLVRNYCILDLVLYLHLHDHHHHHHQNLLNRKHAILVAKQMCFFLASWPVTKGSGFLWRQSPWCLYQSMVKLPAKCLLYKLYLSDGSFNSHAWFFFLIFSRLNSINPSFWLGYVCFYFFLFLLLNLELNLQKEKIPQERILCFDASQLMNTELAWARE